MNKHGAFYTGIIAAMAMATIAMVMYASLGAVAEEQTMGNANRIGEVKRIWQNTRFVLDRLSGEALADFVKDKNILQGSCDATLISSDSSGASTKVQDYLNSALNEIRGGIKEAVSCSMAGFDYRANNNTATIRLNLKCEQELKNTGVTKTGFYTSYSKDLIFVKQVTVSGPTCDVFAIDMQSGQMDANALR